MQCYFNGSYMFNLRLHKNSDSVLTRAPLPSSARPVRADRGLGNWYTLHLTVDGRRVHSGWSINVSVVSPVVVNFVLELTFLSGGKE